jgi:hypothetical protein
VYGKNITLKAIAFAVLIGLTVSIITGCQGAPAASGKGPKVLFFSSGT